MVFIRLFQWPQIQDKERELQMGYGMDDLEFGQV